MSGHNKWSKVKHKKAAADSKKSREFSKLGRLIKVEAKNAGGNRDYLPLKAVVEKARSLNMPKDTIERAIIGGESGAESLERATYEAYGPGGVALIIETLSDNTTRTSNELKHLFSKRGLVLAAPGSATWAFAESTPGEWVPKSTVPLADTDRVALDDLLEELDEHDDIQAIFTNNVYTKQTSDFC